MTGIIAGKRVGIGLGDSSNHVIHILGHPHNGLNFKKPFCFKYGILEVWYDFNEDQSKRICTSLGIMFWQLKYDYDRYYSYNFPLQLKPDDWFPMHDTCPKELEEYFDRMEIPWQFSPYMIDESEPIYLAGYATFCFQNGLDKMNISPYHKSLFDIGLVGFSKK